MDSSVQELEALADKGRSARQRFEPSWYTNIAYYSGHQWLYWTRGRLWEPKLDPWRVTFTDNRIIGIVRTEVAKMTKQKPVFVATPTTGDEEDVAAARLSERMLQHLWIAHDLTRKQRAVLQWARICGAGFWKVYWDSSAGRQVDVLIGPDGKTVTGEDGRPLDPQVLQALPPEIAEQMQVKTVAQGDICVEVRSPMEILVDPLAGEEGLSSAEWLIEDSVRSQEYVLRRYGVELPEDADAVAGLAESRMGPSMDSSSGGNAKGVRVQELWARPSSKHPKGRYVVWAGKKILHEDDHPYDELPYVMFQGMPVPGRFWPTSMVEQLRPIQTELNKTRSQMRENAARIGNPALLKSRLANVDYTGLPGEVIEYDDISQNSIPAYLQPPEMPAYVQTEVDRIEMSLREVSGQHEITQGIAPPGVTAASAISLLQEQDDTRLGPDISEMEAALAEAGMKAIKLVAKFYTDERTIHIAGEDGDWDIFDFRGSMLRECTNVAVQAGSAIPLSKAAKQAAMQQTLQLFIQNGIPISQRQMSRFLRDMEVGGFERLVEQFSSDEAQINGENRRLAQGLQLPINSYDDDEAHVEGHVEFQKGSRYARLPDEARMAFEYHVQAHRDRVQQQQMDELEQQIWVQKQLQPEPPPQGGSEKK